MIYLLRRSHRRLKIYIIHTSKYQVSVSVFGIRIGWKCGIGIGIDNGCESSIRASPVPSKHCSKLLRIKCTQPLHSHLASTRGRKHHEYSLLLLTCFFVDYMLQEKTSFCRKIYMWIMQNIMLYFILRHYLRLVSRHSANIDCSGTWKTLVE